MASRTDIVAPRHAEPTPVAPASSDYMVWIAAATYTMGSDVHYAEERPAHRVSVDGFWIDRQPVTNERFARFVEATGYRTFAEIAPDPTDYPGALPEMLHAGSLVFVKPGLPVGMDNIGNWWRWTRGADWRHPQGPDSAIAGRERHPVVHIAYCDAVAFANWENKTLPTEAEWELASRGGLDGAVFAWGNEITPGGRMMANFWQGRFPHENLALDGWEGTSPVGAFPANGYGLHDMIGNVWEWTTDWFVPRHPAEAPAHKTCCVPHNPRGGSEQESFDPRMPNIRIPRRVLKGGSHLCAANYCQRYRPAARYPQPVDTSTSHVGFRCIRRA